MREQFLVEVADTTAEELAERGLSPAAALLELNALFTAWVEVGLPPPGALRDRADTRWPGGTTAGRPPGTARRCPRREALTEAFLWSQWRTVTKTATVSLHGNTYQVEPALAGRKVELVFSPFNLEHIEVRYRGRSYGPALPHHITRHAHPKARPETPEPAPAPATGIAYLHLVADTHHQQVAAEERIGFHALYSTEQQSAPDSRQLPGPAVHRRPLARRSRTTTLPTTSIPPSRRGRPEHERPTPAGALRIHQDAVRAEPRPVDAAPPRRARRSRRPDRLVHRPARPRRDHRRGRRRARPSPSAPRPPRWTPPGTWSSTCPTRPSGSAACCTTSSPRSARSPASTPRPWPRRPPTRWPPNTPNAAAPRSWSSTRRTCSTTRSWKRSACSPTTTWTPVHRSPRCSIGQPTLRHRLRLGVLAALDQRISVRYALAGMTATETADYITHHLKIAGRSRHPVQRRRRHPDPQRLPRLPAGDQQPRGQRTHRRVRPEDARSSTRKPPASRSPKPAATDRHHHHAEHPGTKPTTAPSATSGRGLSITTIVGNTNDAIIGKINDGQHSSRLKVSR